jgi:alkylhydroperoxidase family enzyme
MSAWWNWRRSALHKWPRRLPSIHTTSARKLGKTEERLYLLDAWCESPLYSERERAALAWTERAALAWTERAALAWTEALTLMSETHAPDDVYRALQAPFTEEEQVTLTLLIVTTNGWNAFRAVYPVDKGRAA